MKLITYIAILTMSMTNVFALTCTVEPKVKLEYEASLFDSSLVSDEFEEYGKSLGLSKTEVEVESWEECYEIAREDLDNFLLLLENLDVDTESPECYSISITRKNILGSSWKEYYSMYFEWTVNDSKIPFNDSKGKLNCITNSNRDPEKGDVRFEK